MHVKLFGLCDNLGGIKTRTDDGRRLDPSVGDLSSNGWYNRRTGEIYFARFKIGKSRFGTPSSFDLSKHPDSKAALDETLEAGHPEAGRK
jgi:hypothetical protein